MDARKIQENLTFHEEIYFPSQHRSFLHGVHSQIRDQLSPFHDPAYAAVITVKYQLVNHTK